MESGNGGASSKGVLIPVPDSSDIFKNSILAPLQRAYLYDESKQFFRYKSAVLVKNPTLEEKYNTFRAKRRDVGYSDEDLEESYGFLLFDDVNKANALRETGVLTGNSTCTTLGDPSKGVYISMYSDCLDLNRWYHGKSGYIAIIRLTKGKVKRVFENYTQNFTAPTVGFDCHVSEQFPSVSAQTSSFLAFERTQCYMYELLDGGSNATAQSPSAACLFAIVSFSYTDTKAAIASPQEKCEEKKLFFHYLPWRGELQIGSQLYNVGLRSKARALLPAKLPPVVKVDWVISMLDLRQLLPRAVFETCFTGEVFLDGLYCSLYELVSTEAEETNSLVQLLWDIKEKDLALVVLLQDGGFFILLHSSHFLSYDDAWSCASEVLQGLFVFPDSRVVMRDTKFGQKNPSKTSEILRILPVLSYAEGEAEKTPIDPSEELCEVLAQHMQSYTALINPGLASSPSREVSMFPFQYDVPDTHLYSSPEWTDGAMQSFRSYLSRPTSFQLPVSRASEILAAGQEERRREDLDDDVYICISSPEEAPQEFTDPVNTVLEDTLSDLNSSENVETSVENVTSTGAQDDLGVMPHNVVPNDLQLGPSSKDNEKSSDLSELNKTDDVVANNLTPPTSDDLPAELIVSITSAEQSVSNETLNLRAKLQAAEVNSLCDETGYTQKLLNIPQVTSFTETKLKLHTGCSGGSKKASKASVVPSTLQTVKTPVENDSVNSPKDEHTKEIPDHPQLSNPSNWRKLQRRRRKCGKISAKNRKLRSAMVALPIAEEKKTDPEHCPLRRKTERWDLKPIISECGKILVPHGSTDFADQIKSLKDKLQSNKNEECSEKMLLDAPVNADDAVKSDPESCTAPETAVEDMQAANIVEGGNDLQTVTVSDVNPEQKISRESNDGNSSLPLNPESNSSNNEPTDSVSSQEVQEKHSENLSHEKCPTKSEFLLRKLKSVLLRGKRKTDLVTENTAPNTPQDTEPCLKKSKEVDTESEALKCNNKNTPSTNPGVTEDQKMQPVDPLFAFALGLTPKVIPENLKKAEDQDSKQKMDTAKTQEQMIQDKQPQIVHRAPSIFTRRGRIKTLKKHQSISAECIKKKWWLHFQTPACFASEKLKNKDCTSDNSVRKTEKMNSAYSPADALNLLADLALSADNDQAPPQPNPSFERKPETSLKKSDLKKDLTSAEQESVLHALLRQPADRSTQPHESPAPSHLVVNRELIGLVSKEHAYSLPPSSSLLLGLPGTSPVSDSSRLHHDQTMYGFQTLQPSVGQEDGSEYDKTPEYLKRCMARRQKFRYSRTFVNTEGCIKVTRHWQENYDFNLDSKFTSDPKDKTIVRALHGPWDFSIQDTNEEVRLIVHMWIGLFYSRSTPRFFHVESNFAYSCSEENDSLEMTSGVVSGLTIFEHKDTAASCPSVPDTSDPLLSKALDLSKNDDTILDQDSVVLDLSLKNSSACLQSVTSHPQVHKKGSLDSSEQKEPSETLNSLKPLGELCEPSENMVNSKMIVTDVKNFIKPHEAKQTSPHGKTICLEKIDVPSFKGDGIGVPLQKVAQSASVKVTTAMAAFGIGQVVLGCGEEGKNMQESTENLGAKEMGLVKQGAVDSFSFVTPEKGDLSMEEEGVVQTDEHEKNKLKKLAICEMKEHPSQEGNAEPSQKVSHAGDDSGKKSDIIVCNGNCLESEKLLSKEENKGVSQEQRGHFKGFLACDLRHKAKVMKEYGHLKEDGLYEKENSISAGKAGKDLTDQPLPVMCNGPDLVNDNNITRSNHQAEMNEQPPVVNNTNNVCHDLPPMLCADGIALADGYFISENNSHTPLGIKSIYREPATKKFPPKKNYLRDEAFKSAVLLVSDVSSSMPQVNDNVEMESQNKEITDCNSVQSNNDQEDQKIKSTEEKVKDDKEQFQHQVHSLLCEARKTFDGQVALTEEADFRTNKTNEGVNKGCIAFESPFTGMNPSEKVIVLVKDDSASHKNTFGQSNNDHEDQKTKSTEEEVKDEEEQFQHQVHSPPCEVPNTSEVKVALTEETDLRTDETNEGLNKSCISDESSFTEIDPLEKVEPMDDNLQNTFEPQPHSPQCEFPKLCETEVAFTEEADFRTSETNEELDKSSIAIDIPFAGRDPSERVTVQVKDDNAIHKNTFGQSNNDHEDQETVSTEEVKDLKQQFQHEVHSPPCEVPKICEAQVAFTKETDLRTNEGLNKSCTGVEIPFIGIDRSEELIVQVKDNTATFQRQLRWKIPKVCEANVAFAEKTDVGRDKKNERLDKRCTEDEISFIGIDASGKDAVLAKVDNATGKEQIQCQPQSLLSEVPKIFEAQVTFTKEIDLRAECKTNEGLDKNCTGVEIPLIGIDSSEKVSVHLHGSHPQGKSGEVVQGQEQIPFISDSSYSKAALTSEICNTTQACSEKEEPCKMLLLDINESYGPVDLGIESDDRCPTPTIDEKPYGYPSCSSPGRSNSALSSSITGKNLKRKCLNTSSAPVHGKLPCEKKPCQSSIVKTDSSLHQILHPDLEARTLRVLQSIDKFLSKSNHIDKSCQIETLKMKESVAQSPEPSSKCTPSSLAFDQPTVDFKDNNEKSALVSSSTSQDLHTESSDNLLVSPFKSKLEEVLGVKLNLKKTDSVPQEYFERVSIQETSIGQNGQFPRTCPSELLQVIKPSLDQERPKPTLQSNVNQESRAYNHRPVLAVKPSKNDESPADYFLVDTEIEKSLKNNPPKTPKLEYSKPTSVLSEKRTNAKSKGCSERLNDNQEASQLSFKTTWLPDVGNSRSNSFPSYQYQRKDISKFDMNPSSPPPMECFESAKSSSKCVDEIQDFLTNGLAEKVEQTVKKNIEMDLKDPSSAAASFIDQRNSDSIDKSLVLGPRSSLVCTVYNNSQKRSYSFLEQVSRRCIQDDLTQASVEQESLIFSEQMKQVLKKSERRPTHQEDSHDKIRLSCTSPLTINFSNLDEQEDSLDYLGASLIGQKIKVDLSNRKDPTDKNEEKMICPGELSEGKYNTVEHDWVSDVTVECARLYEAKMQDVCAFKKVSARARRFRRSCTKTEPSNHFDFCEQMKKEMDKTFRTSLNSVVKKSCRTKYRFYILATSEDVFFEQTKAQLEAEGHTSVQPSEFFPGDDCSSSLIIILKNEDIAEHICEVPQLLELKKSRHVQFAGIDEPDDVLNLTHQELFMQGGFIMFDRTALDALSLCNMKKVSEILLELSKMGKWKWMLHYRDSRRLKENARLSAEAKEKKHFLYWGQEAGILEVLPYHDCDQMSKDQPDYLTCLVRLQVQKISSRFLVFITDTATDGAFESNGILTMTTESFLTKPLSEMFTV
ncbi:uncharacterized protein tasor2 isoform X1 [Oreochromis niloticus]|uniref:uncharacterized protein tasor2 isoform X1 n=1 Tax=Oreochromis niloticus TaxID=8128 RepID=UPI0006741359|nr:uncharacterized protein LOC100706205 isoform X1 [Oreochromis niloticus]